MYSICTIILYNYAVGPFYIAYTSLQTRASLTIGLRSLSIDKASEFYIVQCDEGDNHFYIVHESPMSFKRKIDEEKIVAKVGKIEHKPAIPMYLCASQSACQLAWQKQTKSTNQNAIRWKINQLPNGHPLQEESTLPSS